ncbi:MAG: molybdopterin-guanine dinucleotide biosynthesis protein B [Gemmatimonadota bacterium]|nr:molybdopterin-guanine dinucleotide biosynthesis protein B [Gemmatimonadota bacterium]MDH5196465.1 molybdopterin-guanine dinucleotide biosynthesis protein B [Gemmatimonadota bacterium]
MAETRVISVIGKKDAGKTTLVVAMAQDFVRRGRRVGTIKHGHHPALVDQEGKDTWRHFNEGRVLRTMIESPGQRVTFEHSDGMADPVALVRQSFLDVDIVIVEGFKRAEIPKIEVHRKAVHATPLFDPDDASASQWIAMVSDERKMQLPFPVFTFTDTAWLPSLMHFAWERALVVER